MGTYEGAVAKAAREVAKRQAKVAEWDAAINGGYLVEVAHVMGKPLYVRLDLSDEERARHELEEIQSVVKSVVLGDYDR